MCLYTYLNPCIFLHLLALAAIIAYLVIFFNYSLISASSKCKIHGCFGNLIILSIVICTCANTHTQCYSHLVTNLYIFNLFKQAEFIRHKLFKKLMSEYNKILVFFQFSYNGCTNSKILINPFIYKSYK